MILKNKNKNFFLKIKFEVPNRAAHSLNAFFFFHKKVRTSYPPSAAGDGKPPLATMHNAVFVHSNHQFI